MTFPTASDVLCVNLCQLAFNKLGSDFSQWLIPSASISTNHLLHPIKFSFPQDSLYRHAATAHQILHFKLQKEATAIWQINETVMGIFRSLFTLKIKCQCFSSEAPVDEDQGCYQSYRLSKRDKMCSLISFHLLICFSFLPLA